jgi:hypothetical protein
MMWSRKPVGSRKSSRPGARATLRDWNRRLISLGGVSGAKPLAGLLLWGSLAFAGCATPPLLCQTDCHVPHGVARHHAGPKMARPILPHRKGHVWAAHAPDYGYSRTFWQRFPGVPAHHEMMPWAEEIPQAEQAEQAEEEWRDRGSERGSGEREDEPDSLPSPSDQAEPPDFFDTEPEDEAIEEDSDDDFDLPPFLPTSVSISDEEYDDSADGLAGEPNFGGGVTSFAGTRSGVVRRVPEPGVDSAEVQAAGYASEETRRIAGPVRTVQRRSEPERAQPGSVSGHSGPHRTRFGPSAKSSTTNEPKFPDGGGLLRLFSR